MFRGEPTFLFRLHVAAAISFLQNLHNVLMMVSYKQEEVFISTGKDTKEKDMSLEKNPARDNLFVEDVRSMPEK